MRLIKFINESSYKEVTDSEEEIIKILHRDCKKYLNLIRGLMPFKRGIEELPAPTQYEDFAMYSKNTRKIRKPKGGMFDNLYNVVNEWLIDNGHFSRIRDALISTSKATRMFGDQFFVFPIKMKGFTYVKAGDFNFGSSNWYVIGVVDKIDELESSGLNNKEVEEELMKFLDENFKESFVTNKNIKDAYNKKYEIWFNCREYYFIDTIYGNVKSIMRKI